MRINVNGEEKKIELDQENALLSKALTIWDINQIQL